MKKYFYFGETVEGYEIPVLNEREARAGAGILLLPAMLSFFIAYTTHDFLFTKIFVTLFMLDFSIRIFINPIYAPSLILGRIFIQNQTPEYVGAAQKRFAWSIGFVLSVIMFLIIVVFEYMTPIKIVICLFCIGLLFSETAFGICVGCKIYQLLHKNSAQYCPGNVCQIGKKEKIQQVSKLQLASLSLFFGIMLIISAIYHDHRISLDTPDTAMKCAADKCQSAKKVDFKK